MDYPFPPAFIEKMRKAFGEQKAEEIFSGLSLPRRKAIRINTLKNDKDVPTLLKQDGFELVPVSWYPDAYLVENPEGLSSHPLLNQGHFYIQSLSSMIPALVLDSKNTDHVLDICAAPGSKTSQIAALMHNEGFIIANDSSRERIFKLKDNLARLGVTNTQSINKPGQILFKGVVEPFDKVLVDVPCSMEGRFQSDDPKTWADWSPKKVKRLSEEQKGILRSAVRCTTAGGTIVYSTCTLSPEENEEVIEWILTKEDITLEPIHIKNLATEAGLLKNTVRIFPSEDFEGFFIAKLKKN
ncbi:MAG TPA: RsmB/NOP family class I SAM-dependent RNA methyltransferase [Patescibacteria group bacterium]|nr:RsmB/NOP family class I SAM-dependent RNA methyltransferase [Patescibacteria group bacterium]